MYSAQEVFINELFWTTFFYKRTCVHTYTHSCMHTHTHHMIFFLPWLKSGLYCQLTTKATPYHFHSKSLKDTHATCLELYPSLSLPLSLTHTHARTHTHTLFILVFLTTTQVFISTFISCTISETAAPAQSEWSEETYPRQLLALPGMACQGGPHSLVQSDWNTESLSCWKQMKT